MKSSFTIGLLLMASLSSALGAVKVTGVTARQRYPWNGKVDIVVSLTGSSSEVKGVDCRFVATNSATKAALKVASVSRVGSDIGAGESWTRRFVWDAAADVGEEKVEDVALTVEAEYLGGVQLWENGPYWAECNVGATKPEEAGYYFWWGDTVGYKRVGDRWDAVDGSHTGLQYNDENIWTEGSNEKLQKEGWIDATGNLAAKHDAATAHLGAPWRMPIRAEIDALTNNCTTTWTTRNGVRGRLVKGKGTFASRCIFLPAAGRASDLDDSFGSIGFYWSSTPDSIRMVYAFVLHFTSDEFRRSSGTYRRTWRPIRPLRVSAQ
ncbi:MAG: hypothetical protein ACI4RA_04210 [Kiritimatiellia bacterium]